MSAMCENKVGSFQQCSCAGEAVIRYGGKNLCADCADPNVLALYTYCRDGDHRYHDVVCWHGPDCPGCPPIAALAPKEDV